MTGIRPSSMTLATLLLLASIPVTFAQTGGGGGGSAGGSSGVGGGGAAGSTTGPGSSSIGSTVGPGSTGATTGPTDAPTGSPRLPLPSSRPSAATNPSTDDGQSGSLTAPIAPPDSAGSTGGPDSTGSTNSQQGVAGGARDGNETSLGNIGAETERERRAQEQSDRATKSICEGC
jgi:hypothetical protein